MPNKPQWQNWDWNKSQSRSQKRTKPNHEKPKAEEAKFPSYDTSSLQPSSAASSATNTSNGEKVIEILKQLAEKDEKAMEALQGLIPVVEEEAESGQLRQQQRMLNQIRKLQVKLGKKESAILQRDQQMQKFLQEIRQHVDQEKQRHKKETDLLKEEVVEIKQKLQDLKSGKPVEVKMENDLEDILGFEDEEKTQLKLQLDKANKEQIEMRNKVVYMQQQMEAFMQNYDPANGNIAVPRLETLPPNTPEQHVKNTTLGLTAPTGAGLVKDARAPFGVRPHSHAAREAASPYALKEATGGMD